MTVPFDGVPHRRHHVGGEPLRLADVVVGGAEQKAGGRNGRLATSGITRTRRVRASTAPISAKASRNFDWYG